MSWFQIALVPKVESLPFFQGTQENEYRRQEFERYRCGQAYYTVTKPPVPDICKKYLYSVGFYTLAQGEGNKNVHFDILDSPSSCTN